MGCEMKVTVLIAEDELISRARLRSFLEAQDGAKIVAECATGRETLVAIREQAPDIVFLDVKLPDLDGFDVVQSLAGEPLPAIIFTSAQARFAVRAFEVRAADFLLKPFDGDRLRKAFQRACERLPGNSAALAKPARLDRLTIRSHGRMVLVKITDIDWIRSADNYVELHVGSAVHLMRATITSFLDQLPPNLFARISRSLAVNLDKVKEIHHKSHGDYLVLLQNGTPLAGSRTHRQNLGSFFGGRRAKSGSSR
jgi:two-component system, LytTR family, response regulator